MKISEAIIIYLAIGAPFAVNNFLRAGKDRISKGILHALLAFLLWPIYAISLTQRVKMTKPDQNVSSLESNVLDARVDKKVGAVTSALEMFLNDSLPAMSVLEFREVLYRYTGLTFALSSEASDRPNSFSMLILPGSENHDLNGICMNRRNRKCLEAHRSRARNDFLALVSEVAAVDGKHSAFADLAFELARIVADTEACSEIETIRRQSEQIVVPEGVNIVEKEVWHSPTPKQSALSQI
ncbi:MAG: hypothetical protein ABI999_13405 [Acidobacteriota bacterium]